MQSATVAATAIADEARVLSNPGRVLILAFIHDHDRTSWSDLRTFLEQKVGPVNPNTMHFHIKVLLGAKWIRRSGTEESPVYSLSKAPDDVVSRLPSTITPPGPSA